MSRQTTMIVAINRPIAQVFAFVANAETAPRWQSEIVEVQRTSAGLIGVGTTYRVLRAQLRERVASIREITEYELNKTVAFESIVESMRVRESYTFQSVGHSTRVTYCYDLATPASRTRHLLSREAAHLSDLKTVLEAPGSAAQPMGRATGSALGVAVAQPPKPEARPVEAGRPASH